MANMIYYECIMKLLWTVFSLQKIGAIAVFLKRGYRPKNCQYRSKWTILVLPRAAQ